MPTRDDMGGQVQSLALYRAALSKSIEQADEEIQEVKVTIQD